MTKDQYDTLKYYGTSDVPPVKVPRTLPRASVGDKIRLSDGSVATIMDIRASKPNGVFWLYRGVMVDGAVMTLTDIDVEQQL